MSFFAESAQSVRDFLIAVSFGLIPGYSRMAALGNNPNVTSSTSLSSPQDMWPGGGAFPFLAAATALEILSVGANAANDTAAGTGARTVSIAVLDANYVASTLTITLNGTTPVALGTFLRVQTVRVTSAGTTGVNEGALTIRDVSGGTTRSLVPIGYGWARQTVFTVPAGFTLGIVNQAMNVVQPSATQDASIAILQRSPNGSYVMALETAVDGNPFLIPALPALIIPEKFDVVHRVTRANTTGTMTINSALLGVLRRNDAPGVFMAE